MSLTTPLHQATFATGVEKRACPTNDDPDFDGRYRVKRSTGIPRSLQKQVDRPDGVENVNEDSKVSGVMVNADGDFVIAQPDKASWELYQEKAKAAAAAASEAAAVESSKEVEARGLQCPLDKRMFLQPTKTPCCGKTYCNDCITNSLIDSDFVCPNCGSEEVLLDDLTPNTEIIEKIRVYENEKEELKKRAQERGEEMENQQVSYTADPATPVSESMPTPTTAPATNGGSPAKASDNDALPAPSEQSSQSKKRPASADEDANEHEQAPLSPANAKKPKLDESKPNTPQLQQITQRRESQASSASNTAAPITSQGSAQNIPLTTAQMSQMQTPNPFAPMPFSQPPYGAPFNGMPNFPGMQGMPFPGGPMSMAGFMPGMEAPEGMWNMPNMPFGQPNGSFPQLPPFPNPMMGGGFMPGFTNGMGSAAPMGDNFMNQQRQNNFYPQNQMSNFANQQRNAFGAASKEEEQPYLRQPVNPHRHQGRQKRLRPTDFREL
ncbi:hypothetical protein KEM56_000905 [Ascosphaera pollenicola]|nr:hypothetical protein KEM56_000905 [Ascosphaera pollenicola]